MLSNKQSVKEVLIEELFIIDNNDKADEVSKDYLFVGKRRFNLEEVNKVVMSFNDFIHISKLKNKPTSNIKKRHTLSTLSLSEVGVYSRD